MALYIATHANTTVTSSGLPNMRKISFDKADPDADVSATEYTSTSGITIASPVHQTGTTKVSAIWIPAESDYVLGSGMTTILGNPSKNSTDALNSTTTGNNMPFEFVDGAWSINEDSIVDVDGDGNVRDVEPLHIEWQNNVEFEPYAYEKEVLAVKVFTTPKEIKWYGIGDTAERTTTYTNNYNANNDTITVESVKYRGGAIQAGDNEGSGSSLINHRILEKVDLNPTICSGTGVAFTAFGTTFMIDRPLSTGDVFDIDSTSTPALYDCKIIIGEGGTNARWKCENMLIQGVDIIITGSGVAIEMETPFSYPPKNLRVFVPNFGEWSRRAVLVQHKSSGSTDANRKYVFEGAVFPAMAVYGFPAELFNNRGAFLISSLGSGIPFGGAASRASTQTEAVTASVLTDSFEYPMILKTKELWNAGSFFNSMDSGTVGAGKRYRLTFDEAGYTLRVRRTNLEEYEHYGHRNDTTRKKEGIIFAGSSKASNGLLLSHSGVTSTIVTANTLNNTKPSGYNFVNASVNSASDVEIAYEGLDITVSGTEVDLILPYMYSPGNLDVSSIEVWISDYEIYIQKDDKSGSFNLSKLFNPIDIQSGSGASGQAATLVDVSTVGTTNLSIALSDDPLFSTTRVLTSSGPGVGSMQMMYDVAKTYLRIRESETAYDSSHLASDTNDIFSVASESINFGSHDIEFVTEATNPSDRVFSKSGTDLTIKVLATGDVFGKDTSLGIHSLTTTGDMDLDNLTSTTLNNAELVADNFTNVPTTFPTTLSLDGDFSFSANTVVNAGTFTGTWTYTGVSAGTISLTGSTFDGLTILSTGGALKVTTSSPTGAPTLGANTTYDITCVVNTAGISTIGTDGRVTLFNLTRIAADETTDITTTVGLTAAQTSIEFGGFGDSIKAIVTKPKYGTAVETLTVASSSPAFNVTLADNTAQSPGTLNADLTITGTWVADDDDGDATDGDDVLTVTIRDDDGATISPPEVNNLFESLKSARSYADYYHTHEVEFVTHSSATRTNLPSDSSYILEKNSADSGQRKLEGLVDTGGEELATGRIATTSGFADILITNKASLGFAETVTVVELALNTAGIATSDDVASDGNKTRNFVVGV